jgi:hypothetical protein
LDDVSLENAWTCRQCSLQTWDVPKRQLKTSGTSQVAWEVWYPKWPTSLGGTIEMDHEMDP